MDLQGLHLRPNHEAFIDRFVNACQADDRIVAAFLGGSNVKGYADAYSDVDLCVITTDESFERFFNERESFLRSLGDLVFLEDFDIPDISFYRSSSFIKNLLLPWHKSMGLNIRKVSNV